MSDQITAPDQQPADDSPQQTIPYQRFKTVNDRMRAAEAELATLKAQQPPPAPPATPIATPPAATPVPNPEPSPDTTDYRARWEQARQELDGMKLARLRDRAAVAHGIPLELSDKLAGTDEASITADALRLKGYLGRRTAAPSLNADTPGRDGQTFTIEQISDHRFYAANRDAIDRAAREGRITR